MCMSDSVMFYSVVGVFVYLYVVFSHLSTVVV